MKFSIRHADKIVGFLIILALAALIFVIIMLGSNQRWFARDGQYKTYFNSASGISANMPINYKGFTIGHVKNVNLTEGDLVEITFTINEEYTHRVTEGSLVEVQSSPIPGLGGGFIFHPGKGTELIPDGGMIPEINSLEAKQLRARGLTEVSVSNDSINNIINQVNTLLDTINVSLAGSQGAEGLTLGQILLNIEQTTAGLTSITDTIIDPILAQVYPIFAQLNPLINQLNPIFRNVEAITSDLGLVTDKASDPSGTIMALLDADGALYKGIEESIESLTGIIQNLERTSDFIPSQLPQIAVLINEVNSVLRSAQDVLTALTNNPLLRGGIPERAETGPGGANPRNLDF